MSRYHVVRMHALLIEVIGAALVVAGIGLFSVGAAMIMGGVFVIAFGVALERSRSRA